MPGLTVISGHEVDDIFADLDVDAALAMQSEVFVAASTDPNSIQSPHRVAIESALSTSLFMPSHLATQSVTACKIVSIPRQGSGGLPAVTMVMNNDGEVVGVVNARKLTAIRNACGAYTFVLLLAGLNFRLRTLSTSLPANSVRQPGPLWIRCPGRSPCVRIPAKVPRHQDLYDNRPHDQHAGSGTRSTPFRFLFRRYSPRHG
jgi:hypothetical protein